MLRVGGFGSVLPYAEGEPLSAVKGMEEATWKSERSGTKLNKGVSREQNARPNFMALHFLPLSSLCYG